LLTGLLSPCVGEQAGISWSLDSGTNRASCLIGLIRNPFLGVSLSK
jgi:hypothetical protein